MGEYVQPAQKKDRELRMGQGERWFTKNEIKVKLDI
jgi:hypothetical protein